MSFHTTTMMINWIVTSDKKTKKVLRDLKKIPLSKRKYDKRVETYVQEMFNSWKVGTTIERLGTFGWNEFESICLFCDLIDIMDELFEQYNSEVKKHGKPPPLKNEDLLLYEEESKKQRDLANKSHL